LRVACSAAGDERVGGDLMRVACSAAGDERAGGDLMWVASVLHEACSLNVLIFLYKAGSVSSSQTSTV